MDDKDAYLNKKKAIHQDRKIFTEVIIKKYRIKLWDIVDL